MSSTSWRKRAWSKQRRSVAGPGERGRRGRPRRMGFEPLEDRRLLSAVPGTYETLSGSNGAIAFCGDFTKRDSAYSTPLSSTTYLGLPSASGAADFQPLYAIQGQVSWDTSQNDPQLFVVTDGTISSYQAASVPSHVLWQGAQQSFNVDDMLASGMSLDAPSSSVEIFGITFKVESLGFGQTECDDQSVSSVALRGQLETTILGIQVELAIDEANYVSISDCGFSVTGASVEVSKLFKSADGNLGLNIANAGLRLETEGGTDNWAAFGSGTLYVGAALNNEGQPTAQTYSQITVAFGDATNPGIAWDSNGDIEQVTFGVSGSFTIAAVKFTATSAFIEYTTDPTTQDPELELGGTLSVTLNNAISAGISLGDAGTTDTGNNPGLVIDLETGAWTLNGITLMLDNVDLGPFKLQSLELGFTLEPNGDYDITGEVFLVFPRGWGVGGSLEMIGGQLNEISFDFKAGSSQGIPVADTGLFLTEMSASVGNLLEPANLIVSGSLGFDYGGQVTLGTRTVSILRLSGGFLCDANELTLSAGAYLGAYTTTDPNTQQPTNQADLGSGTADLTLDWGEGLYSGQAAVSFLDNTIVTQADFQIDVSGTILMYAQASLDVPTAVPVIGGDTLLSGTAVFEYYPHGTAAGGFLAAWTELIGQDAGFEYNLGDFNTGDPDQNLSFIGTSEVQAILSGEVQANGSYTYPSQYTLAGAGASFNPPQGATAGIFSVTWPSNVGGSQSLEITLPNGQTFSNLSNGQTVSLQDSTVYNVNTADTPPADPGMSLLTLRIIGDVNNAYESLPSGTYKFTLVSNVNLGQTPTFTHTFAYAAPTLAVETLTDTTPRVPTIQVPLSGRVDNYFGTQTTVTLYVDDDAEGYDGVAIASSNPDANANLGDVDVSVDEQGTLTATATVDITGLRPKAYYFYGYIDDGYNAGVLSTNYSAAVTPYPPLYGTVKDTADGRSDVVDGVTVFLDLPDQQGNYNGTYDGPSTDPTTGQQIPGEPTCVTSDGYYSFSGPGPNQFFTNGQSVHVGIVVPLGYALAPGQANPVIIPYDGTGISATFEIFEFSSISGTLYNDWNQNGVYDFTASPPETGVGNGLVTLAGPSYSSTATTNNDGSYTFYNVPLNQTYTITYALPSGYFVPVGDPTSQSVTVGSDQYQKTTNVNFGVYPYSTISGTLLGYPIVAGVSSQSVSPNANWPVTLSGTDDHNNSVSRSTTTDANGNYRFTNLLPGSYVVNENPHPGWAQIAPYAATQAFTGVQQLWSGSPVNMAAMGDLNGDGALDVVISLGGSTSDSAEVVVLWGNPNQPGTYGSSTAAFTGLSSAAQQGDLALGDVNGDSYLDIVVIGQGADGSNVDGYVQVLLNVGYGNRGFFTGTQWQLFNDLPAGTSFGAPTAADLNGDGKCDLVLAVFGTANGDHGNSVYEFFSNGSDFSSLGSSHQASWGGTYAVGDIDGDSVLDIAYMYLNTTRDDQPQPAIAFGQSTNHDWTIAETVYTDKQFDTNATTGNWALGDVDGDGNLDLILESNNTSNILGYYLNPGSRSGFSNLSGSPQQVTDPGVPFSQWQLVVADFDGNGAMDLADLGQGDNAHLYIYKNQQQTPWIGDSNKTDIAPGYAYQLGRMTRGDINGDGLPDLLIADDTGKQLLYVESYFTAGSGQAVSVSNGSSATTVNFTNQQVGQVTGLVYLDANRNQAAEPGERGQAGVQVYVDLNRNGLLDAQDRVTTSGPTGRYAFTGLSPGSYQVRVVTPSNLIATSAGDDYLQARVGGAARGAGLDFGLAEPLLASIPDTAVAAGTLFDVALVTTAAARGHTLFYRLIAGPAGVSIDQGTRLLTWQAPEQASPSNASTIFEMTVEASDPFDPLVREAKSFTVTVSVNAQPNPWQNPRQPLDVNGNGVVEALDVLLTIDLINFQGVGYEFPPTRPAAAPFYDADGDGRATALDLLLIINAINSAPVAGEGEAASRLAGWDSPAVSAVESDLASLAAALPRSDAAAVAFAGRAAAEPVTATPDTGARIPADAARDRDPWSTIQAPRLHLFAAHPAESSSADLSDFSWDLEATLEDVVPR